MHTYLFILGRNHDLSLAEIRARFGDVSRERFLCEEVAIFDFKQPLNEPQKILDNLGGTIKICELIDVVQSYSQLNKRVADYLVSHSSGKVIFALSIYNIVKGFKNTLKELLKNLKNNLRKSVEGKVRFLNKPDRNIKSVVVFEEKLDLKGTDIVACKSGNEYFIGQTIAVQNFKRYSIRDYDRPARDAKSGMLPPKVAQMMINFATKSKENGLIYDPFCGSGTILMEGLLMGYDVLGSDISEKAALDSQKNLDWICNYEKLNKERIKGVFVSDATVLSKQNLKRVPDFIVSEVYLGPPLFKIPNENEIKENFKQVEDIILGFLKNFGGFLPGGVRFVLAIPFYNSSRKKYFIDGIAGKIERLGFSFENTLENLNYMLYFRPDQIVGRQILSFYKA